MWKWKWRTGNWKIKLELFVTEHQRNLIRRKMTELPAAIFAAYARKMLIDSYVIHVDMADLAAKPLPEFHLFSQVG